MRSKVIMSIFSNTAVEQSHQGLSGFNYLSLRDTIKWHRCSRKEFTPILLSCMNYYIKGIRSE